MDFRKTLGQLMRVVMVILVTVSFALFFDVFMIGTKTSVSDKTSIRSIVSSGGVDREIAALKNRHQDYMKHGIGASFDYADKSLVKRELPPLSLPPAQDDDVDLARSMPLNDGGVEENQKISMTSPSLMEPVLSKKNEQRLANFSMTVAGVEKAREASLENGLANIEPAAAPVEETVQQEMKKEALYENVQAEPIVEPVERLSDGKVRVVVIIDDMGVSSASSTKVENLPAPLTLSYLPYAENLPERTKRAKERGHELMVHMPMQPMSNSKDGGPSVLRVGMDDAKFQEILLWGLSQFDGYVGVNNHMGSRLTKDRVAMDKVMAELAKRDVYFVDSKTIGSSVGSKAAAQAGLRFADRDVFLDHEISEAYIASALRQLEATARRKGYAIAIGHPHPQTIKALEKWIPTLAAKGIDLVPASAVVRRDERYIKVVKAEEQSGDVSSQ